MKKTFNTAGVCSPTVHYMMDNSAKIAATLKMVETGTYFTISRPRQYGKTTLLVMLTQELLKNADYVVVFLSLQGIDEKNLQSDSDFARFIFEQMVQNLRPQLPDWTVFWEDHGQIERMDDLSVALNELTLRLPQKLVLLIDEVDANKDYDAFLNFLGMLRNRYLSRFLPHKSAIHSVVLAGVHNIKNLKYGRHRVTDEEQNSPWNIAADFTVDLRFAPNEIRSMLEEYRAAEGVDLDSKQIADHLFYYTAGYPFLISRLCQIVAEQILPQRMEKSWETPDTDLAVRILLKEQNTNFKSLIRRLDNNPQLYALVYRVIIEGEQIPFNIDALPIKVGVRYGIFEDSGKVAIQNRIYEQWLYNYLVTKSLLV